MINTNSIFSEKNFNAVKTAYTLHAVLNRPAQNRRQQSRVGQLMADFGNVNRFRY